MVKKRPKKLAAKLNILTISVILVTSVVLNALFIRSEVTSTYASIVDHGKALAESTAQNCELAVYTEDRTALEQIIGGLRTASDVAYAEVMNKEGTVLGTAVFRESLQMQPLPPGRLREVKNATHHEVTDPRRGHRMIEVLIPVMAGSVSPVTDPFLEPLDSRPGERVIGYLRLGMTLEALNSTIRRMVTTSAVFTPLLVLLFSALTIPLTRRITQPLRRLTDATRDISEGRFDIALESTANDEVSELTRAFTVMSARLAQYRDEVETRNAELHSANDALLAEVSARKAVEEQLRRSYADLRDVNNEIKSFAYIVSHDLRAPLLNIKGFSKELDLTLREIMDLLKPCISNLSHAEREEVTALLTKDFEPALYFITSSVTRMDWLINSILNLSRIGRREIIREPIDLEKIISCIIASMTHQLSERAAHVSIGALPVVHADQTAMEQIFGNLLDNAVKYLDQSRPGEITVTAEQRDGDFIFAVADNGRGIAEDDIPKVFELFRRAGKQDMPGEGMGLAYVRTLVRRHDGRIWCESELGRGTTFFFSLPVQPAVSSEPDPQPQERTSFPLPAPSHVPGNASA